VPPEPGVLSAFGMLVAPVRKQASRTVLLADPGDAALDAVFADLEAAARAAMDEEGLDPASVSLHRQVAARYRGQSHELLVPGTGWRDAFHAAHRRRFGYDRTDAVVEAVTLAVDAVAPGVLRDEPPPAAGTRPPPGRAAAERRHATATVRLDGADVQAAVVHRTDLPDGAALAGPAILTESTATLWLPPGWTADVLADGALHCTRS
jgi:N-methylhydantoinase A/oxoprolinase/acetone carboxylase beta subunit